MKTRITKNIGGITDRYWAKIVYNEIGAVSQIQFSKLVGNRSDSREEMWFMDGNKAVDLIRAIHKEIS